MLSYLFNIGIEFKNLYFNPISFNEFTSSNDLTNFGIKILLFFIFMSILHSIVIYITSNINNSYTNFRMILLACIYSFVAAFTISKIFQVFFTIGIYFMPYIGQYLDVMGTFIPVGLTFIFEYLLMINRLDALYQRNLLESEAISADIFIGILVATGASFLLFYWI